jgi:D-amino peptidase
MKGIGDSTISIHPELALEKITEGVKLALMNDLSKCLIDLPKSFSVEILYKAHAQAYRASFYPGVKQIESHRIQFETSDYFEVIRALSFII